MNIIREIVLNQLIRIPAIQRIAMRSHNTGRNNDPVKVNEIFDILASYFDFGNKEVLELGPGQTFGLLERAHLAGAASVSGVDISSYNDQIANYIEFKEYNGKEIPFSSEKFDFVYSYSVFEHLRYPEITVSEIQRVLKTGGVAIHSVDLKDHFNYSWMKDELTFNCLKYSEQTWNAMVWNRSNYVNRLRYSDWCRLFDKYGLIISDERLEEDEGLRNRYKNIPYLNKLSEKDALTGQALFVLKKI